MGAHACASFVSHAECGSETLLVNLQVMPLVRTKRKVWRVAVSDLDPAEDPDVGIPDKAPNPNHARNSSHPGLPDQERRLISFQEQLACSCVGDGMHPTTDQQQQRQRHVLPVSSSAASTNANDRVNPSCPYQAVAAYGARDAATVPISSGSAGQFEPCSSAVHNRSSDNDATVAGCDSSTKDSDEDQGERKWTAAQAAWHKQQRAARDDVGLYPKLAITADRREMRILLTHTRRTLRHKQMYGMCASRVPMAMLFSDGAMQAVVTAATLAG